MDGTTTIDPSADTTSDAPVKNCKRKLTDATEDDFTTSKRSAVEQQNDEMDVAGDAASDDDTPFTTVERPKQHRSPRQHDNNQKDNSSNYFAYIKGMNTNIAKEAVRRPHDFKKEVAAICGEVVNMEARNNLIRVNCTSDRQREALVGSHVIIGRHVEVTKPWSLSKDQNRQSVRAKPWKKGVITRVPTDWTDQEIKEQTNAIMVKRITNMVNGGISATTAVILAFEDELPAYVYINLLRHRVATYVPRPMRCNRCQIFGHRETQCHARSAVCARCSSREHQYADCPIQNTEAKCANCGGNHNAAYRGCPKFKQVRSTLTASAKLGISYRDAAAHCKKTAKENTKTTTAPSPAIHSDPTSGQETPSIKTTIGTQTEEIDDAAPTATSTGYDLTNDQIMCLLNTTATALLWLVKQSPAATAAQEQVIQQLSIVLNVIKQRKSRTENQQASGRQTEHDNPVADAHHAANAAPVVDESQHGEAC